MKIYMPPPRRDPGALSLAQHFAVATAAVTAGMAAAFVANETIVPVLNTLYETPVTAFAVNFGTLFAVTGAAAGYAEETLRQFNAARHRASPWGPAPRAWWNRPLNP